jgi:hypothetical protein
MTTNVYQGSGLLVPLFFPTDGVDILILLLEEFSKIQTSNVLGYSLWQTVKCFLT